LLHEKIGYALNESLPHGSDIAVHTVLFKSKFFHYPEKLAKHRSMQKKMIKRPTYRKKGKDKKRKEI